MPSLTQAVDLTLRAHRQSVEMKYEGGSFYIGKLDLDSHKRRKAVLLKGQPLSVFSTPHSGPLGY